MNRPGAIIGAGLLLVTLVGAAVIAFDLPSAIAALARSSPVVSTDPGEPTAGAASSPGDVAIRDPAWWRIEGGGLDPAAHELHFGTLGQGQTGERVLRGGDGPAGPDELLVGPRVRGPVAGQILVVERVGPRSVLSVLDAVTGHEIQLLEIDELIYDAAFLGPRTAVFLTVDPQDGAPNEILTIDTGGGARPESFGHLDRPSEMRLVAVVDWITALVVSSDGTTVAVYRCERLACHLRAVDAGRRQTFLHELEWGSQPVAILGDTAILQHACVDVDCRPELFDLVTGVRRPAPQSEARPVVEVAIVVEPSRLLVSPLRGDRAPHDGVADPVSVEIVDLETMEVTPKAVQLRSLMIVEPRNWGVGLELPPNSILVQGSAAADPWAMGYYLVDLETGRARLIDELGEVFLQG